jgi:drug/metabolite transporter (DMT)-like permease
VNKVENVNFSTGCGLVAILLWSSTFAVARSLSEQVGPVTAAAAVYLFGGFICLAHLSWSRTPIRQFLELPRKYLIGCGSLFVANNACTYLAVGFANDRLQALEIALINYLWPAATIILSLPLLGKRANGLLVPGTLLALGGVFMVLTQGDRITWQTIASHVQSNPAAYALALGAALSWALYSNLTRRWAAGSEGAVMLFLPASGLVLLFLRLLVRESSTWSRQAWTEIAVMGTITAVAYVCWEAAMRKGNLLFVAASSYFTPLFSTLMLCVYLKVSPGPQLWLGCALLVAGSLISWRSVK